MFSMKLSNATGTRFKALLEARDMTGEEFLHSLIVRAIADGEIPPGIPGFRIDNVDDETVNIVMDGFETGPIGWLSADVFGGLLRSCAAMLPPDTFIAPALLATLSTHPGKFQTGPSGEGMISIGGGRGVAILSIGSGVAIKLASAAKRSDPALKSLSRTIAAEFGGYVQAAADRLRSKSTKRERAKQTPFEHSSSAAPVPVATHVDLDPDAFPDFDTAAIVASIDAGLKAPIR